MSESLCFGSGSPSGTDASAVLLDLRLLHVLMLVLDAYPVYSKDRSWLLSYDSLVDKLDKGPIGRIILIQW